MSPDPVEPSTDWALTVHQPWAALLALGLKATENRPWRASYRGPVLLHAGRTPDHPAWELPHVQDALARPGTAAGAPGTGLSLDTPEHPVFARGEIVAAALLHDIHPPAPGGCCYPWGAPATPSGPLWHWVFTDPWVLPAPVPATGRQRMWHPDADTAAAVWAQADEIAPTWAQARR